MLELPRGGKIRAQDAGGRAGHAARSSPSPTPTRTGSPTRCAQLVRAFADPHVGYACGQVRFVQAPRAAAETRRASTGATRWPLRALESRLSLDHRRQRRDLRHPPRCLHRRRPDHGPRPVAARSTWSSAGCARSMCQARSASEKMVPSHRRRVRPQAANDEPHLADRPTRWHALAARLPAAAMR